MTETDPGNLYNPPAGDADPDALDPGAELPPGDFVAELTVDEAVSVVDEVRGWRADADEAVAELTTSTTEPPRPPTSPDTPEAVSIVEAVAGWEVARRTLRRRLADNDVEGAYKVPGPKGAEWRIPTAALDALGYRRRGSADPVVEPPPTFDPTPAERLAQQLAAMLDGERKALAASHERELTAREEAARYKAKAEALGDQLTKAEAETKRLAAELDAARTRRWWGRRRG